MIFENDFGFINFIRQVPSYMQLASKRVGCNYCFNVWMVWGVSMVWWVMMFQWVGW